MSEPLVLTSVDDGIAHVILNRPHRHNALIPELLQALRDALAQCVRERPAALILSARGRSFSTGGDVPGFQAQPAGAARRRYAEDVVGQLNAAIVDLLRLPCPSVAAVHGMVTGGSIGLVLGCDLIVAGPRASFAPWYVDVGFSPDGGWTALLPARIGAARALEIQLLNRGIGAEEAHVWGLVNQLVAVGHELTAATDLARCIAGKRPGSVRRTLALMRPDPDAAAAGLRAEYDHFIEQIDTEEADTGMTEFLGGSG